MYNVSVKKKFKYVKIYRIIKRMGVNQNIVERAFQKFIDRYVIRKPKAE